MADKLTSDKVREARKNFLLMKGKTQQEVQEYVDLGDDELLRQVEMQKSLDAEKVAKKRQNQKRNIQRLNRKRMDARKAGEDPDKVNPPYEISHPHKSRQTSQTRLDKAIDLVVDQQKADSGVLATELNISVADAEELLYQMTKLGIIEKEGLGYKVLKPPLSSEKSYSRNEPWTSAEEQKIIDKNLESAPKNVGFIPSEDASLDETEDRRRYTAQRKQASEQDRRGKLNRFYRWLETKDGIEWAEDQVLFSDGWFDDKDGIEYLNSNSGKRFLKTAAGKKYTALRIDDESRKQLLSVREDVHLKEPTIAQIEAGISKDLKGMPNRRIPDSALTLPPGKRRTRAALDRARQELQDQPPSVHRLAPDPTQYTRAQIEGYGQPPPDRITQKYDRKIFRPLTREEVKLVLENVGKLESGEFKRILKEKGMSPPVSLSRSLRERAKTLPENGDVLVSALTAARNTAVRVFTGDLAPIKGGVSADLTDYKLSKIQAIFDLLRNMESGNKYFEGPQNIKTIPNPPGRRYSNKGEHARFNFRHKQSAYHLSDPTPHVGTDITVADSYLDMRNFFKNVVGWDDYKLAHSMYDFSLNGAGRIQKEFLADVGLLKRTNYRWVLNHSSVAKRNPKDHYGGKYGSKADLRHDRPQWFPSDMKEGEAIVSEQNNIWPPNGDPTFAKQNALPSSPTIYYKQPWKDRQGVYTEGKSKGRSKVAQGTDIFRLVWDYEITPEAYASFEQMKNLLQFENKDSFGEKDAWMGHDSRNFLQAVNTTNLPYQQRNITNILNLQIDASSLFPSSLQIQEDNSIVLKEDAEPIKIKLPEGQDKLALPTDEYTDLRRLEKSEQRKQEVPLPEQATKVYTPQEMKARLQEKAAEKRKAQADRLRPKPAAQSAETDLSRRKFILGQSQKGSPSLPDPKNVQQPMKPAAEPAPKMPSLRSAQPVRPLTEGGQRSGRPVPPVPGTGKPTTPTGGGSGGSWFSNRKRPKYQEGGFITF